MNRLSSSDLTTAGITANLLRMHELLLRCVNQSSLAEAPLARRDLNQAFGTLIGIESTLEDARTLHRAAVILHQCRRH